MIIEITCSRCGKVLFVYRRPLPVIILAKKTSKMYKGRCPYCKERIEGTIGGELKFVASQL